MPQKLELVRYFLAQLPQNALTLAGVTVTFVGFWAIGRVVLKRSGGESALLGWALVYLVALVAAVVGANDLRWIAWLSLGVAVISLYFRRRELAPSRAVLLLLLPLLPMVGVTLLMPLLHWDSYWHWVLNGSYLYRLDSFPQAPLDGFTSFHPTYPAGSSLVYYFASLATGRFLPSVGLFTNIAASLIAMGCVARLLHTAARPPSAGDMDSSGFFLRYTPLWAFLIVLPLNPCFQAINYYSAIVDPMLGVIVLMTIVRWCSFMAPGEDGAQREPGTHFGAAAGIKGDLFQLFMLGVLISAVKPSGWVLAFVLSAAGGLVGLTRRIRWSRWLMPALAVLAGALLAHLLWQNYLRTSLDVGDQFSIQPLEEWRFDLIPGLVQGVLADLRLRYFYYGFIFLTMLAGWVALWRRSLVKNETLAVILSFVAVAMVFHLATLFAAYLGTGFTDREIERAASLHRYSTHIGFAVCVAGWVSLLATLLPHAKHALRRVSGKQAIGLSLGIYAVLFGIVILLPSLAMGSYFRRSFEDLRSSALRVAATLPTSDTVVVFGEEWSVNLANYASWNPEGDQRGASLEGRKIVEFDTDLVTAQMLLDEWMADASVDHVWFFNAHLLNKQLGLQDASSLIWSRSTGTWRVIE